MTQVAPAERLADWVGPIVVKEVRQGLRGRVFTIFFGLLLAACFTLALVAVADGWNGVEGRSMGRQYFGAYLTALAGVCFFVIPFVAYRSMVRELEDETWVLLALTGLGGRSVVRGKWVSAMSQAGLFASACAPFVLFSYFLNGVDLVQIAVALVLATAWCALLVALALALATQAHSRLWRSVTQFLVLGLLVAATAAGVGFSWVLALEGQRLSSRDELRVASVLLGVLSAGTARLLLEAGAASLALPTESASARPRKVLSGLVVLGLAVAGGLFVVERGDDDTAAVAQVFSVLYLVVAGVFSVSERDGWVRHAAREARWLEPGAWRSAQLLVVLLALSTVTWLACFWTDAGPHLSSSETRRLLVILGAPAYAVLYLSLGVLLGRRSPLRALGEAVGTRLGFLGALVVSLVVSPIVSVLLTGRVERVLPNALNPLFGLVGLAESGRSSDRAAALALLAFAALVAGVAAAVTLRGRHRERAA